MSAQYSIMKSCKSSCPTQGVTGHPQLSLSRQYDKHDCYCGQQCRCMSASGAVQSGKQADMKERNTLPWSTWPMTVTTAGLGWASASTSAHPTTLQPGKCRAGQKACSNFLVASGRAETSLAARHIVEHCRQGASRHTLSFLGHDSTSPKLHHRQLSTVHGQPVTAQQTLTMHQDL